MRRDPRQVLFISHYYTENLVGTQRLKHLVRFLEARGFGAALCVNSANKSRKRFRAEIAGSIMRSPAGKVFVSCGPFYYLLCASLAAWFFGKHLIVDFRDPWSFNVHKDTGRPSKATIKRYLYRKSFELSEKIAYFCAASFIVCTHGMHLQYSELFRDSRKMRFVPNGYDFDPSEIDRTHHGMSGRERFICIGKFFEYSERKAKNAIELALARRGTHCREIEFIFYSDERTAIEQYFAGHDPDVFFQINERVPYKDVLRIAAGCDCGLAVIRNEDFDYGTKIYDFIGLGIPLLDTFDHGKDFFRTFSEYFVSPNSPIKKFDPDPRYDRTSIWNMNMDLFEE